ncbi:MAG: hypothetical protein K6F80_00135 [Oscillospiraceae bacterium]|jgi:hypothetical protein|nr:hypothetical protein [Oscillospiraceae bacterium]
MPKSETRKVIAGLEKLAFGKVNDAVTLAFADEIPPAEILSKMNLFHVSSIKRVKGGGVEVQFFDRQKALERLYEYAKDDAAGQSAASLLAALTGGNDNGS